MSIKSDLALGKKGQDIVAAILQLNGYSVAQSTGKCPDYDIKAVHPEDKLDIFIEVKYDRYSVKSQNLAFEYYNPKSDKPSGVMSSKSHIWIQIVPDMGLLAITLSDLKKLMNEQKPLKNIQKGGDGNSSMLIYSISSVEKYFTRLDLLSPLEIRDFLNASHS